MWPLLQFAILKSQIMNYGLKISRKIRNSFWQGWLKNKQGLASPAGWRRGFSIIELLMAFATIGILSGLGIASFVSYSRNQVVDQASADLKTAVERTKFNALSGVKPANCDLLLSYQLEFCKDCAYSYKMIASCKVQNFETASYVLPKNVSFENIGCGKLKFNLLSKGVECEGGQFPFEIGVKGFGVLRTLSVDNGGNVSIK